MPLAVDLGTLAALEGDEERRKRERRERRERTLGSINNLLTLVGVGDMPQLVANLRDEAQATMFDRSYEQGAATGEVVSPETRTDYFAEYREPGLLTRRYEEEQAQGATPNASRYMSVTALAEHLRERPFTDQEGRIQHELYWPLLSKVDQGASSFDVRRELALRTPLTQQTLDDERLIAAQSLEEYAAFQQGPSLRTGLEQVPEAALEAGGAVLESPPMRAAAWPVERLHELYKPVEQMGLAALRGEVTAPETKQAVLKAVVEGPVGQVAATEAARERAEEVEYLDPEGRLENLLMGFGEAGIDIGVAIADPLNLVPILGFTHADDFIRALQRLRTMAKSPAARRMAAELAEAAEPVAKAAPKAAREVVEEAVVAEARVDPAKRLVELVGAAKPLRVRTEILQHAEMQRRAGAVGGVLEAARAGKYPPRRAGIIAKGKMKGELPRPDFDPPALELAEADIDDLFKQLVDQDWGPHPIDYVPAYDALEKVVYGGQIPTRSELRLLERVFGSDLPGALLKKRPLKSKIGSNVIEALNIPRALRATFDLSATLRQGAIYAVRHPKEVFGNVPRQVRAFFSEEVARQTDEMLRAIPEGLYDKDAIAGWRKIFHAERGPTAALVQREEVWISRMLHNVPIVGPIVRGSERAYVTYLNKLRKDLYYNIVRKWQGQGKTLNDYLEMADTINKGSGRGSLGPLNAQSPLLSAGFFAPRFAISRFQYPLKLFSSSPAVRSMVAQELASFIGAGAGFLAFLKYSGLAEVELDPRSTDFGKMRIGKTRVDFWGGWQPMVRYAVQVATGERKASSGFVYDVNQLGTLGRFVEGKLSPQAGFAIDVLRGQTFVGEETLPTEAGAIRAQLFNRFSPMFVEDVVTAMRAEGLLGGMYAVPAVFGVGVQTYQTPYDRITAARSEVMVEMGVTEDERRENPALRARVDADPRVQAVREELDADVKLHGGQPEVMVAVYRREIRGEQMAAQRRDDGRLDAGTMSIDMWRRRTDDRAGEAFNRIQGGYDGQGIEFEEENYQPGSIGEAIERYYDVKLEDYATEDTGDVDWDSFRAAQDQALAGLSSSERGQAIEYIHQYWTEKQWEIDRQEQQVQDYFDIPEQVYQQHGRAFGLPDASYFAYRSRVMAEALQQAGPYGVTKPVLRRIAPQYDRLQRLIQREREAWRRRNPAKTKLLIELGFKTPSAREAMRFGPRPTAAQPVVEPELALPVFEGALR